MTGISIVVSQLQLNITDNDVSEDRTPGRYQFTLNHDNICGFVDLLQARRADILLEYDRDPDTVAIVSRNNISRFLLPIALAYAGHLRVRLTIDDFMHVITSALCIQVATNPEKYRSLFTDIVDPDHNVTIAGSLDNINAADRCIAKFDTALERLMTTTRYNLHKHNFMTTNSLDDSSGCITNLRMLDQYFNYTIDATCGIKEIILVGHVECWQRLSRLVSTLDKYDLPMMKQALGFVCSKILDAHGGKTDPEFWRSMFVVRPTVNNDQNNMSGTNVVHGWINTLFPFVLDSNSAYVPNTLNWSWKQSLDLDLPGIPLDRFPTTICEIDVVVRQISGDTNHKIVAGHLNAVCRNLNIKPITLQTCIGYIVMKT